MKPESAAMADAAVGAAQASPFTFLFTVFVLAIFVGYYVVWHVTPALMSFSKVMGFAAVLLASINIFGGFIVSQRMLQMYRKKK